MTRKRFVKLLMADGHSRNAANILAAKAQNCGLSYSTAYKAESDMQGAIIQFCNTDFTAVCEAVRKLADAAAKVASAIVKAACAFVETYTKEMGTINNE